MKKPLFYLLVLLTVNFLVFFHFSFFLLLIPLYAILLLSKNPKKTFFWLCFLNLFIGFWVGILWFCGESSEAIVVLVRANVIVGVSLGLYYGRDYLFVVLSLQDLLPKKLNILIFLSAKMMGEFAREIEKSKQVFQIRSEGRRDIGFVCRTYGCLIGKLICHGLQRVQKIEMMMRVRGYNGYFYSLLEQKMGWKDWGLLCVVIGVVYL